MALLIFSISCWPIDEFGEPDFPEGETMGYKPIYSDEIDLTITAEQPRAITSVGQILTINDLVLFVEAGAGVHVVDNSDLQAPQKLAFIRMAGIQQLTLREGILYASQYTDLVSLDISDLSNVQVIKREEGILNDDTFSFQVPPASGYFICPDESKGQVVAWEYTTIVSPKCFK